MADGMFLDTCKEISKEYPEIKFDEQNLDRVCLQVMYYILWIHMANGCQTHR
jgi:isocitrate/isopropylmalate dehydrogenase